jgi:hypothetical protein
VSDLVSKGESSGRNAFSKFESIYSFFKYIILSEFISHYMIISFAIFGGDKRDQPRVTRYSTVALTVCCGEIITYSEGPFPLLSLPSNLSRSCRPPSTSSCTCY